MSGAHAILAPSSAARWVACAGSARMAALYPEEPTQDTREGEASHWAASEMLHGQLVAVGQIAPNGVTLNAEMIEGADMYVETVDATLDRYGCARESLHVEERVYMPDIHAENWGTPDCWFQAPNRTIVGFDYKFGHRYVEVFENWQLVNYVAGILSAIGIDGTTDRMTPVELTIVQPRSYHRDGPVRSWSVMASELRPLFNKLAMAAEAAMHPDATVTPNDECQFCPARHVCPALQRAAYKAADVAGTPTPVELPPSAIGIEAAILRQAAKRIEARLTGIDAQIESLVRGGQHVPGYALEPLFGREEWNKPADEIIALGELYGVPLAKPGLITPTQARKAKLPDEVVAMYCGKPNRGQKLVIDDGVQARKVFGK